ncbi:hypothetical protein HN51_000312 [Arachis hypogaea]
MLEILGLSYPRLVKQLGSLRIISQTEVMNGRELRMSAAMSCAFGNRMLKRFVVAEPETQDQEIDEPILARDGLWDVVLNDDAITLACTEEEPEAAARELTEATFSRGGSAVTTQAKRIIMW